MNPHEMRNTYRDDRISRSSDVNLPDSLTSQRKAELMVYRISSNNKKRQSHKEEDTTLHVDSLTDNTSVDSNDEFKSRLDLDWTNIMQWLLNQIDIVRYRPRYMSVFRKVWLLPIPFCLATLTCSAFWNLGQVTSAGFLSDITAVIAYPLILVLLLSRLIPPIRHEPLLNFKQKLVSLPLTIALAIFAGWVWSIMVNDYRVISSRWDLCWWCMLIGVTCGILAYL
jgi:hypothetical protein